MRVIDVVEIVADDPGAVFEVMEQGNDTVDVVIDVVVTVTMYMMGGGLTEQVCETVVVVVVPDMVVVDCCGHIPEDEVGLDVVEDTGAVGVEDFIDVLQVPGSEVVVVTVTRTGRVLVTVQQLPDVIFP